MALPDYACLMRLGEYFAAGYFEQPDASPMRRWSLAARRRFENRALPAYGGEWLYPSGPVTGVDVKENQIVAPSYSYTWAYNHEALTAALTTADGTERDTLEALDQALSSLAEQSRVWSSPHTVGGWGYTHSIPNYGRVLREGLDTYAARVTAGLQRAEQSGDAGRVDFYLGLSDVVEGIRSWHRRIVATLENWQGETAEVARRRGRLLEALWHVPFKPARSFYEALVAYNLVFYMDDCDNPGRIDRELFPFYEVDIASVELTRDHARDLLRAFTDNVAANDAWSSAIGGSLAGGKPAYNEVTTLCLEAVHHRHRPSYELGVRVDMPDVIWDAALDAVATGCGQPAFYNDWAYIQSLMAADLGVTAEDVVLWNGGGCTETIIHGCSNVGSLDAGIHLPLILEKTLQDHLPTLLCFDDLLDAFKADVDSVIADIVEGVNRLQQSKAQLRPQPMRSLLIDDCIDRGEEFNAGGARYNWSVVNVAGIANVVDSMQAIKETVFDQKTISGADLLAVLARDFAGHDALRQRLRRCARFGNDVPEVDGLAAGIAQHVFDAFRGRAPWRGGHFLPSTIMFTTYAAEGAKVGATPDGRRAGEPLADSIGPVTGRDRSGPTAMLRSVTRLPLHLATGTPVLNMRFSGRIFTSQEGRRAIRDLITTYFEMGGMQIQLTVVDREVLEDALQHPELHEDLIVRVGGFSAYFNSLSPALQQAILERTEHTL